jgi:site-specific DNA-methyltransferase (adenine-specific)
MKKFKGLMTSLSPHWATPQWLYGELDKEFHFNDDPCPLHSKEDGLTRRWGTSTFVNPPYGRSIKYWIAKAWSESFIGKTVVMLLPARCDTYWWHEYVMSAYEIRFIRGRLKFGESKNSAPFPSCVVIFRGNKNEH